MPTTSLTFVKGMNTDADKSLRDGSMYLDAKNFTRTSIDGSTLGAFENVKGNELRATISFAAGHNVVGYANVVRNTVFFTTDGSTSNIYYYEDGVGTTLKYSDASSNTKLNFSLDPQYRIVAVGRQELLDLEKVYWADGLNELRYMDLSKDYTGMEADSLNIVPPNDLTASIRTGIINGSGLYTSGTVYHSYQFYTLNGASSTISSVSNPVRLSQFTSTKDGGNEKDEDVNASVNVSITGIDSSVLDVYNRIRIYSIHYSDSDVPIINIAAERNLIDTSINIIDTGNFIGSVELGNYLSYNQTSYIPKAIESKDNNLFIGNIIENAFTSQAIDDWDARAYRFDSGATKARLYTADESSYIDVDSTNFQALGTSTFPGIIAGDDVPEDFDCHNKYNNIYTTDLQTRNTNDGYKYAADGTTVGGEGVNVKFDFNQHYRDLDSAASEASLRTDRPVLNNQSDAYTTIHETIELQEGEVYRIGIKFYNSKGQSSFVKWIADVLTEEAMPFERVELANIGGTTTIWSKYSTLRVQIKNFPSDPDIVSYQIVRAIRTNNDKAVAANGALYSTQTDVDIERPSMFETIVDYDGSKTLFKFISPETMFNNPGETKLEDYKVRVYNSYKDQITQFKSFGAGDIFDAFVRKYRGMGFFTGIGTSGTQNLYGISDYKYLKPEHKQDGVTDVTYNIGSYTYINQVKAGDQYAGACSSFIMELDSPIQYAAGQADTDIFMASLIRNTDKTRYGGIAYQDILNTTYIPCSEVYDKSFFVAEAVHGDTVTTMYYAFFSYFQDTSAASQEGRQELICFPVQSTIDTRRRLDRIFDYYIGLDNINTTEPEAKDLMFIQETVEEGIQFQELVYDTAIGDLYRYNPAYSAESKFEVSFPKPFDFIEDRHSTTKVLASEKKINGEAEDQWTNFLPNNFIEVDSAFGPLNDLKTKDSTLFFWQDKAFGVLAVNDRSLITDASGAKLALGTGGVLERYDYYSNEIGNVDKYNIIGSENSLFWVYSPKSDVYIFDTQVKEISTSSGLKSYLVNKGPIVNPISITDSITNETLFKINDEVLVYDWMNGNFTGIYTFVPEWFVKRFDGNYLSSEDSEIFYLHNSDNVNRANFYGIDNKSSFKHIYGGDYRLTKVYDTMSWDSSSTNSGGVILYDDTFDRYRIYTDYQNTDWQDVSWKRKERSFTTIIPRDRVNAPQSSNVDIFGPGNLDASQTYKRRIRDKYIVLDMEYDNSTGNKFSVPYINVNYRQSIR